MSKIVRDSKTGRFIIGRKAFARVSAVEGITVPKTIARELERLDKASDAERRRTITRLVLKTRT